MKIKKICTIILCMMITFFSGLVKSQNCGMFYTMVNGAEFEMTSYDTLNQPNGKTISKISNVVTTDAGTMASVQTTVMDKTEKVTGTSSASVKCTGNSVYVDMRSYIPAQSMSQWKDMAVKTDAGQLEIPQTLSVGMKLKDATMTVSVYKDGVLFTKMKIDITNRLVASQESVTTTAGTFNCYKITQDMTMETMMMGMTIPVNIKSAEYYSAGTGMVKSQTYNKEGKLMGYSLLTKITKP